MKVDRSFPLLVLFAVGLALLFHVLRLPGAWLFGPLAVSAFFAVKGWHATKFANPVYIAGQALIGTALGAGFSPATLSIVPKHPAIFSFAVAFILLTSLFNGWLLSRFTKLDSGTAFLGTMPGGAGVMASMSDSLGANTQLVTAIQYVRLLVILGTLACVAAVLKHHGHEIAPHAVTPLLVPQVAFAWWKLGALLAIAVTGWLVGMKAPIPAGAFLIPVLLYFLLSLGGVNLGTLPWPVLAAAYVIMGMQIGGRFHPSTLTMIRSSLLPVIGTTLLLLLASIVLAFLVAHLMEIDLTSAYLAATPGGLDSVAAVATDLHVDTTIIVSMHLIRLLCVLLFGPWLVRLCARPAPLTSMT